MAGTISVNTIQLGNSATATQNFVLQTNLDGTAKLSRGNVGATTQDVLTIDASGLVALTQGRQMTLSTVQTTTSGTLKDFTVPAWAKRITIMPAGVSTNGASYQIIQIGPLTTPEVTGYASNVSTNGLSNTALTTGFYLAYRGDAAAAVNGMLTLTLQNATTNTWVASGVTGYGTTNIDVSMLAGIKSLAGVLGVVRATTVNGTDAYDAGSINILVEG